MLYSMHSEMAMKPNDIICRRVPISFIDNKAAQDIVMPKVVEIMAKELGWSDARKQEEIEESIRGLRAMK